MLPGNITLCFQHDAWKPSTQKYFVTWVVLTLVNFASFRWFQKNAVTRSRSHVTVLTSRNQEKRQLASTLCISMENQSKSDVTWPLTAEDGLYDKSSSLSFRSSYVYQPKKRKNWTIRFRLLKRDNLSMFRFIGSRKYTVSHKTIK